MTRVDQMIRILNASVDILFCCSCSLELAVVVMMCMCLCFLSDDVQAAGVALDDRQKAAEPPLPLLTRVGLKALGRTALLLISTCV